MNPALQTQLDHLVDDLARHDLAVVDHFLSPEEVNDLLKLDAFQGDLLQLKRAGIGKDEGKQINEAIRGDYIQWIDRERAPAPVQRYLAKLDALRDTVNRELYAGIRDAEIHLTRYPIGTFYKRHLDQFKKDDHRKLSVICYLNKDWQAAQGGQLRVYPADAPIDIFPEAGRLVCFRSDKLEHEVLPATRERLSITGWMINQLAELRYL
ncbi:MAG: 2OG-Fe(II) oxygenase [Cyclobacteriaceae bacterium]|nr:2OG-Fe(II) oxygenase [Flammeovirgaceae bacterium]